ncbi:MAG: M48 family metallopeptidase [Pigmentiphaga sp.]|nr:M48 family metallopeptidase [Pigmentiphaga sp.]
MTQSRNPSPSRLRHNAMVSDLVTPQLSFGFTPSASPAPAADEPPTPALPAKLPMGARLRRVMIDDQSLDYLLLRSRRKSIGFRIGDDGLRVTAPQWVSVAQIDEAIREKAPWIRNKLHEWKQRKERLALNQTRWEQGGTLPYLGQRIVLNLDPAGALRFSGDADQPAAGDVLLLPLASSADPKQIQDGVQAWLHHQARRIFDARLQHFQALHGLKINQWRLSSASTRWGSCTQAGNIRLNWRLIHFPLEIIDYVIVHELAHLREMNHSSQFWAEVEQLLPGFESARDALRRHDPASLPQFL